MTNPVPLVEVWRGDLLESFHFGHAVVCDGDGQIVEAWGDPDAVVYPRSSAKMIQALPLVTSGAAEKYGLGPQQLALASASHSGADLHVTAVQNWVEKLGLGEADFCCGPQTPKDRAERERLIRADQKPSQFHNNCSGKHAGFLTLNQYLGGDADYTAVDHPVQQTVRATFDALTGETSQHVGLDGCSAPNFSCSMRGMARAMAWFATAHHREDAQSLAAVQIRDAMMAHPELVAGEGRACTRLMRAMDGKGAVKTGAEAYFIAILPEIEKGVALKITDGGTRAAESAIAAILVRLGVLHADHPDAQAFVQAPITNWRGLKCGEMRPAAALLS
ncbi:asparaginase [Epibacterium sp. SM1979]|uniref:Asparaginase n=1 Tax=Tritonibacter litoralis TaxID=2662264 RepID=A0A843YB23_9RHOB|nr:asparaginase [Tritonibacter litoralis]MQQ08510.1 asparaginase [Tritonibacter litoralis]